MQDNIGYNPDSSSRNCQRGSLIGKEIEKSAGLMKWFLGPKKTTHWWQFSCYFPVFQALLWAPSPRFWFLCSSFALGGLATKGLRLPSLKSDVHSTCWFFKQLCPQKIRTSRSPSALGGIGGREGGWGVWSPSYQTLFLCLSFSFSHSLTTYLSLSFPKCFFFSIFLSFA